MDPRRQAVRPDLEPIDPDLDASPSPGVRRTLTLLAAVAAGGAIGAPARYELSLALPSPASGFPLSTFLINVSGSLLIGVLLTLMVERWPPTTYARPFVVTGILGAYTTWSTFMVGTDRLLQQGRAATALAYVAATLAAGVVATSVGIVATRRLGRQSLPGSARGTCTTRQSSPHRRPPR